ncbi:MAG: hypothetical protein C4308_10640 [Chitinophagaceae bacterium]
MKLTVAILLFVSLSVSAAAQCPLKKTQDPYTKELRVTTGFIPLTNGKVSIMVTRPEIDFMFVLPGGNCFDDASSAMVLYEGLKIRTNIKNGGADNCDGIFHFIFRNAAGLPTSLQNLSGKKVSSIKFKDNAGKESEITLIGEQQTLFTQYVNCMLAEAKALLQ